MRLSYIVEDCWALLIVCCRPCFSLFTYFLSPVVVSDKRRFRNWTCDYWPWTSLLVDGWCTNVCFDAFSPMGKIGCFFYAHAPVSCKHKLFIIMQLNIFESGATYKCLNGRFEPAHVSQRLKGWSHCRLFTVFQRLCSFNSLARFSVLGTRLKHVDCYAKLLCTSTPKPYSCFCMPIRRFAWGIFVFVAPM